MNRFTFSAFEQHDENRQAFEVCQTVANLQPVKPLPVLLIGPSGSGKTHLLCAIIDHVRHHAPKTALAYVTAKEFPEAVRALAEDPAPVTRARTAILLVDQLEKFPPDLMDLLGRIAPLFLDQNRCLVIAAQDHPENMPNLPAELANLTKFGRIARIEGATVDAQLDNRHRQIAEPADNNEGLLQELQAARAEIARLSQADAENKRLHDEVVKLQAEYEALQFKPSEIQDLLEGNSILEQEVRSLQRALDETRKQRDTFQADSAALAAVNAELARMRRQLETSSVAPDTAAASPERVETHEEELNQAKEAARNAQAELSRWAIRAQTMIQQIDLNRARFAQTEENCQQSLIDLRQSVAQIVGRNDEP